MSDVIAAEPSEEIREFFASRCAGVYFSLTQQGEAAAHRWVERAEKQQRELTGIQSAGEEASLRANANLSVFRVFSAYLKPNMQDQVKEEVE